MDLTGRGGGGVQLSEEVLLFAGLRETKSTFWYDLLGSLLLQLHGEFPKQLMEGGGERKPRDGLTYIKENVDNTTFYSK